MSNLGGTLNNHAMLLSLKDAGETQSDQIEDSREARDLLQEAITHQEAALALDPENSTSRQYLKNHWWLLARRLLDLMEHQEAAEATESMVDVFGSRAEDHAEAATLLARCAKLASGDVRLSESDRVEQSAAYRSRQAEHDGFSKRK